jgi:dienelactone hydrolase
MVNVPLRRSNPNLHTIRTSVTLAAALLILSTSPAQRTTRPDPADSQHPFDTPAPAASAATSAQLEAWRQQARKALFLDGPVPAMEARDFGTFQAMPGIAAHRITFGTQYGMRVPAIVYEPIHPKGKVPAIIVVAGHGGDKSTWYEIYAGLLYASAGAVVVTYDPIGEGERNAQHMHDARAHDTNLPGLQSPARLGGLMIGDVSQALSYALTLTYVDPKRVAVLGYSMGSFHSVVAAGLDPRIRYLVLSGGGDLDGNGGSWDSSTKVMCQGGPYQSLSFLSDKGAILYALHQQAGETLLLNGEEDNLLAGPHHGPGFFADLNLRVRAIGGPHLPLIDARFYPGVGHRPSWVNRDAAEWLNERLQFPRWRGVSFDSLGETRIGDWAAVTGARINQGYGTEKTEAGVRAVGRHFPAPSPAQLEAVPMSEWSAHQDLYTWQGWAKRTLHAEGLQVEVPDPELPRGPNPGEVATHTH